jgi:YVTN family beta-propeller protein
MRMETQMKNIFFIIAVLALVSFTSSQVFAQDDNPVNIAVGGSPLDVEVSGDKIYVSSPVDGVISIIDATSKQVVDTILGPKGILFIEVVEEKNKLYATVEGENKVYVFDLQTHEQIKQIDIGEAEIVMFSKADKPYGQREYTYFATSGVGLAYNNNNQMLYVVHSEVNHVNVIDTEQDETVGTITVGITPVIIKIDELTNKAYVTNWESNDVSVIDLNANQVTNTIRTGFVPSIMEIDSDEHRLYVSHHGSPTVSVINLVSGSVEKQIQLQAPTHALVLDKESGLLHITYLPTSGVTGQAFLNRVEFIDTKTSTLVGGFDIPANPFVMKIDDNQQLYASVINDGIVFVVDLPEHAAYQEVVTKGEEIKSQPVDEGGCLIATAAFGSELAPQVQLLREVRDNVLFSTSSGTRFMAGFNSIYYSFSPTVADWERNNPVFKELVKTTITPMLSTLSILNYVDIDSEQEMLGYGIGVILLNLGMYFVVPAIIILKIRAKFS